MISLELKETRWNGMREYQFNTEISSNPNDALSSPPSGTDDLVPQKYILGYRTLDLSDEVDGVSGQILADRPFLIINANTAPVALKGIVPAGLPSVTIINSTSAVIVVAPAPSDAAYGFSRVPSLIFPGKAITFVRDYDDSRWIEVSNFDRTVTNGLTAFATGGQASATALPSYINRVSTVASIGDSVKLPIALPGMEVIVINDGASSLNVFPQTSESIDSLAANAAFAISTLTKNTRFVCAVAGNWKTASGGGGGSTLPTQFGSTGAPRIITTSGITSAGNHMSTLETNQMIFVTTAGGEINVSSSPQITAHTVIGAITEIHGTSNDNFILLENGAGLFLTGQWRSFENSVLGLRWIGTGYTEIYRTGG
jgi:hypothetical protein